MLSCNVNRTVSHWILDSPLNYELVFRLQKLLAARHIARKTKSSYVLNETNYLDTLIITEHKPVYTVGIRNKMYSELEESKLKALGAEFFRTNRGGLITFHGPGQLVAYPIIDLCNYNKSMKWYVCKLEETIIQLCDSMGIQAVRSSDTGVWVKSDKICAIGIHGNRYITTHGLALNCNTNLDWFKHIVPCGIHGKGVTSISKILEKNVTLHEVLDLFLQSFSKEFHCTLKPFSIENKREVIHTLKQENPLDLGIENQLLNENSLFNKRFFYNQSFAS